MCIHLLLVDDHQVILDGFTSIFDSVADIRVIGTCRNGRQAVDYVQEHPVHVILMDINMPILNGVEACKIIKKEKSDIKIIALSMYDQMSYFKRMMQHGADGYLLKDDSAEEIEKAIRTVFKGERFVSSQLKDRLNSIDYLVGKKDFGAATSISPREQEVLELLSQGLTDPQIGEKLFISFHTAKTHRKKLILKFDAKNSAELIKKALEKGFI